MITILVIAINWLCGIGGGALLWLDWKRTFPDEAGRCPTRKGAAVIAVAAALGPLLLIVGLGVALVTWVSDREPNPDSWWNRPIC